MKRTIYIYALKCTGLVICLWLNACSSEQLTGEALPLEIEATIPPLTKAITEKTAFENNDKITVALSGGSGSSADYQYDAANSRWLPVSGSTPLTTTGGGTFTAVWKPEGFTGILADQNVEGNYAKSNRLTSTATAVANLVQFKFAPAAAKLTIVVTYQNDVAEGAATITGNHLLSDTSTERIACYLVPGSGSSSSSSKKLSFVALVYPGSKSYLISVSSKETNTDTKTNTHKVENTELKAGYNYTYNFSTDNRNLLILNSVTVSGFTKQPDTSVGDAT